MSSQVALFSSVNEISREVQESARIANEAVNQARIKRKMQVGDETFEPLLSAAIEWVTIPAMHEARSGPNHPRTMNSARVVAGALAALDRGDEAAALRTSYRLSAFGPRREA